MPRHFTYLCSGEKEGWYLLQDVHHVLDMATRPCSEKFYIKRTCLREILTSPRIAFIHSIKSTKNKMEVWPFLKQTQKKQLCRHLRKGKGCNTTDDVDLRWISFGGCSRSLQKCPTQPKILKIFVLNCRSYASFALLDLGGPENIGIRNWSRVFCVSLAYRDFFFRDEDESTRLEGVVPQGKGFNCRSTPNTEALESDRYHDAAFEALTH